ncbi:MAG: threonine synthase, partial [Actinomycetota bacterium]
MRYTSSRGRAAPLAFPDVLLQGLAEDGGLYLPERWPPLTDAAPGHYAELAVEVMYPFVEGTIDRVDFAAMVDDAYASFDAADVCPLVELEDGHHLLELFHGPTLAFKDVALQLLGRLFDHELDRRDERVTIVGATSGDTGSAAMEAVRHSDRIDIVILFPNGRTSDVQRRQMTTLEAPNVHAVAIDGTFDDCQDLVKAMFADEPFRSRNRLSAVNSINWARVMAQVVYYVWASQQLDRRDTPTTFCVPTGNFGNVFAGHVAASMGLPVERFIVASNSNDILTRLIETGEMIAEDVLPTLSPSMDIQISSNLERLLVELLDGNGPATAELLQGFREHGRAALTSAQHERLRAEFAGTRLDDD